MTDLMGARMASHTSPTPTAFRVAHPDVSAWSAADHEVYEHLIETEHVRPAPTVREVEVALTRSTTTVAYWQAEQQLAQQVAYDLAAGGR